MDSSIERWIKAVLYETILRNNQRGRNNALKAGTASELGLGKGSARQASGEAPLPKPEEMIPPEPYETEDAFWKDEMRRHVKEAKG